MDVSKGFKALVLLIWAFAIWFSFIAVRSVLSKPGVSDISFAQVRIAKPDVPATAAAPVPSPTPAQAFVQILPNTPVADPVQLVWPDPAEILLEVEITENSQPAPAIPTEVFVDPAAQTVADLGAWVIPLDPTSQAPGNVSPYDASSSDIAAPAIIPLPPEVQEMTLDEMWDQVEALGLDERIPLCTYPLPQPWVTWEMAKELSELQTPDRVHPWIKMYASDISRIAAIGGGYFPGQGIVQILEDGTGGVKGILIKMYYDGEVNGCRNPVTNKPDAYNVQNFLNRLASEYLTIPQ